MLMSSVLMVESCVFIVLRVMAYWSVVTARYPTLDLQPLHYWGNALKVRILIGIIAKI